MMDTRMRIIAALALALAATLAAIALNRGGGAPAVAERRYALVRDVDGSAVVVDLQSATSRVVRRQYSDKPLVLAEDQWSAGHGWSR